MPTLRIVVSRHSAFYSPLIAAVAGGFLEQEGIEGCYLGVPAHGSVVRSLVAREAHVGQSAVSASWTILEQGAPVPIVHFAQINQRDGFFIAARAAQAAFSWSNLLEGRLMFVHGGQPQAMLRYALHRNGVDLAQVRGIDAGGTDAMLAAFRRGEGDFFHEQGPYPQQLEHEGGAHVVAAVGEAVGPVAFSSLAARPEWLGSTAKPSASCAPTQGRGGGSMRRLRQRSPNGCCRCSRAWPPQRLRAPSRPISAWAAGPVTWASSLPTTRRRWTYSCIPS